MAAGKSGLYGGNSKPGNKTPATEHDVNLAEATAPRSTGINKLSLHLSTIRDAALAHISYLKSLVS